MEHLKAVESFYPKGAILDVRDASQSELLCSQQR